MKNIERYHLITEIFSSKNTDSLRLINLSPLILSCTQSGSGLVTDLRGFFWRYLSACPPVV